GSVISTVSNAAGSAAVQGNQFYSPYGTQLYNIGSVGTAKGFTGQYADDLSGLDYYVARYYDPVVGRFLSVDTKQDNLHGFDPYAYVTDNPETKNDPTGLAAQSGGHLTMAQKELYLLGWCRMNADCRTAHMDSTTRGFHDFLVFALFFGL